jgi:fatty-acyl-CoA synthase
MSGSTCPIEIVKDCISKLNTKNIVVVYGMTEASPLITMNTKHDTLENRTQTVGKIIEHVEVKIVDAENRIVPVNQPGELLVRGYNTMLGYWGDKEKTDETYTPDRFLRTGYFFIA